MFKDILDDDLAAVMGGLDPGQVGNAAWEGAKAGMRGSVDYGGPGGVLVAPVVGAINGLYQGGRNAAQQLGW